MTNYVLLYTGGDNPTTDDEMKAVMDAWGMWYGKMGESIVDGGNPFGVVKSVTADGVSEGAMTTPSVTGYTIISADSLDAAVDSCKDHPHLKYGGQISVYETFQM